MPRAQTVWTKILGILLIVLGLTLLASPLVTYTRNEQLGNTRFSVKRDKYFLVPWPMAALIACSGVVLLAISGRSSRH